MIGALINLLVVLLIVGVIWWAVTSINALLGFLPGGGGYGWRLVR
jgi:uncharacterized membrane protein YwzB